MSKLNLSQLLEIQVQKYGSMSELARQIGIKVGTFHKYIRGESFPSGENLEKISEFLNIPTKELLGLQEVRSDPEVDFEVLDNRAESYISTLLKLPDEEKIRLARLLLNAVN